jgi:hypothetical protein
VQFCKSESLKNRKGRLAQACPKSVRAGQARFLKKVFMGSPVLAW